MRRTLSALGLVMTVVLAGCEVPPDALTVMNETDETLIILQEGDRVESEITVLRPGTGFSTRGDCYYTDLIARSEGRSEYARKEAPFCREDGPWIITGPDPEEVPET